MTRGGYITASYWFVCGDCRQEEWQDGATKTAAKATARGRGTSPS
jgi:hypothetical protein